MRAVSIVKAYPIIDDPFRLETVGDFMQIDGLLLQGSELLSNLVFESFWSCGDLAFLVGFNSVFERDACDDFGEVVKAA